MWLEGLGWVAYFSWFAGWLGNCRVGNWLIRTLASFLVRPIIFVIGSDPYATLLDPATGNKYNRNHEMHKNHANCVILKLWKTPTALEYSG